MSEYKDPLFSVVVVSYNSSKFVLETLESVKVQTYRNIELIVSDDGSKDDTVEICRKWVEQNRRRFHSTKIITVEKNSGIPANCNRGINASNGEYIKIIAGDDALRPHALTEVVGYFLKNSEIQILQTRAIIFNNDFSEENYRGEWYPSKKEFYESRADIQYKLLLYGVFLNAPAVFFKKTIFEQISFDEEFNAMEDYPFWILATKNNFKVYYYNESTVNYRVHKDSVQKVSSKLIFTEEHINRIKRIREKYYTKNSSGSTLINTILLTSIKFGMNKNTVINKLYYKIMRKTLLAYNRWKYNQIIKSR